MAEFEDRMFLLQPTVVFAARVNMVSVTYPVTQITFDGVTTGAHTAIKANMTLLLGTSAGADDLGRQRVHTTPATSTVVYVGRSSEGTRDGELTVDDNAYITVLNDYRVWAKVPAIESDGDILKDGTIAYSDQTDDPPPIAVAQSGTAGTINGSNVLEVDFDASDSNAFDTGGTGLTAVSSYLWDVVDGTITVGTSTSAAITVTFPAGFRWVILRVGTAATKFSYLYIPVFARDPADDDSMTNFQISERVIRPAGGQRIGLRIYQELPRATYPDGTLCMIWNREPIDGADRAHIQFIGWHHNDDTGVQSGARAILKDTTLTFLDVAGKLATLVGKPQLLNYDATPATWEETKFGNVLFYIHYLLYWHSTALELGGLRHDQATLNLAQFKTLESDEANLYDQVHGLAQRIIPDHWFTCDRQGQLQVVVDPNIQNTADRSSTIQDTLDESDWMELRYPYQRPPRVYQLKAYGVSGGNSAITPIASVAPGTAAGQGEQYIETSQHYVLSGGGQFSLNVCTGNRYARLNARYGLFTITLPYERLSVTVDPAYLRWVRLTVSAANSPQRGLGLTNQRGLIHEINVRYDYTEGGVVRTATVLWEMETSGPAGVTVSLT